jgi:hypothetical protein
MLNTRARPSDRRGAHPRGSQPKPQIALPDGGVFWPTGGVVYDRPKTGQLLADRPCVLKYRGRR